MMFRFAKHEPMLCLQNLPERINFIGDWFVTNKLLCLLKILGLFVGFTIFRKIPQKVTKNILLNIKIMWEQCLQVCLQRTPGCSTSLSVYMEENKNAICWCSA